MRHRKFKYQLNRFTSWRKATIKSLLQSLILYQSITTTITKAKALRPWIERLIWLTKEDNVTNRRKAFRILCDHRLVKKLFEEIGPLLNHRISGYVRIFRMGRRRGDDAQLARIEFVEIKKKEKAKKEKAKDFQPQKPKEEPKVQEEEKQKISTAVLEKPKKEAKPSRRFLKGIQRIFKKERDSL